MKFAAKKEIQKQRKLGHSVKSFAVGKFSGAKKQTSDPSLKLGGLIGSWPKKVFSSILFSREFLIEQ